VEKVKMELGTRKSENEANDSKKGNFTLGKVKTTKFVKETCDSEICEIFSKKFRKNIEIMFKSLEKAVLLVNTAVFTLPIITIMETHYLFWNFKKYGTFPINIENSGFISGVSYFVIRIETKTISHVKRFHIGSHF
jgi:hypothetical protein